MSPEYSVSITTNSQFERQCPCACHYVIINGGTPVPSVPHEPGAPSRVITDIKIEPHSYEFTMDSRSLKIWTLLIIDSIFLIVEIVVGYAVGSLALVADAFHMLKCVHLAFGEMPSASHALSV